MTGARRLEEYIAAKFHFPPIGAELAAKYGGFQCVVCQSMAVWIVEDNDQFDRLFCDAHAPPEAVVLWAMRGAPS